MLHRQKGAKASKEKSMRKLIEFAIVVVSLAISVQRKRKIRVYSLKKIEVLKVDCMNDVMENGIYSEQEPGEKVLHDRERIKKVGVGSSYLIF